MLTISPTQARLLLKKITRLRILVIGDVMLDHYLWGDATRISPEAPVPIVHIHRDSYTAGAGANVALNLAALGAKAVVAGCLQDDEAGRRLADILKKRGIKSINLPSEGQTIIKTRVIVQHQQLCRLDRESPPANYAVDAETTLTLLRADVQAADAVILSDYAKGLLTNDIITALTKLARAAGKFIALDPKPKRNLHFAGLDLLTPNRKEAAQLAGLEWDPQQPFPTEAICARIHERHRPRYLVITLSEDGMLLCTEGRVLKKIPTAAREVFDVSGAGDTAIAGLVLALAVGADLETAAHFANAAAGVVVGKLGTATVTPEELIAYVSRTL
jgi:D-beta-D-heptose 7-phosphate kinase/D-beta-D-heptose 1-phosphate adenosyltransferase